MGLVLSFALILKDINVAFLGALFVGFLKEVMDPVFTISDFVADFLGCSLAFVFLFFLIDNIRRK
jgi:ABC-type uncharacterized transport system permease subunit